MPFLIRALLFGVYTQANDFRPPPSPLLPPGKACGAPGASHGPWPASGAQGGGSRVGHEEEDTEFLEAWALQPHAGPDTFM